MIFFQILRKDFLVNINYFSFNYHFIVKQRLVNLKIFFKKYFTVKQMSLTVFALLFFLIYNKNSNINSHILEILEI